MIRTNTVVKTQRNICPNIRFCDSISRIKNLGLSGSVIFVTFGGRGQRVYSKKNIHVVFSH